MYVLGLVGIGIGLGLIGRLMLPGRHGLALVVARDAELLPSILTGTVPGRTGVLKILIRDIGLRWTMVASMAGTFVGYFVSRQYASSPARGFYWAIAVIGGVALVAMYYALNGLVRTSKTRRLGVHGIA